MAQETAQNTATATSYETLTMEEINARFDGEWVLLENPWSEPGQQVLGGTLLSHSASKDEVHAQARVLRPKRAAFLYIGRGDEDMEYLL